VLALLALCAPLVLAATSASASVGRPRQPSGPSCGTTTPMPKPGGGYWTCTFDDEFSGGALDSTKWAAVTTAQTGQPAGATGCFVDSPSNVSVGSGVLSLTTRQTAPYWCTTAGGAFPSTYTSGQVSSFGKFFQTYGRFSIRAKFPGTTVSGLHSALWLWPQYKSVTGLAGEIDIAEEYSVLADRAYPAIHYAFDPSTVDTAANINVWTNNSCMISNVGAFHEYTLTWTPTTMTIQYDGQTCLLDNYVPQGTSPFDQPFFLALTQTFGVANNAFIPSVTPVPSSMQVDWVRVWK
jgi:beta-glucanase (GH16 family)